MPIKGVLFILLLAMFAWVTFRGVIYDIFKDYFPIDKHEPEEDKSKSDSDKNHSND